MMTLGHVILLLLLSSISCQNNRNPKQGGRPVKKASTTGAEVTLNDYTNQGPGSVLSSSKGSRGGNQQGASANKPTNDMKLHLLRNTPATCNDGTMAGFYLKEFKGSRRWLIFLEGGWCCYNKETCDSRYKNIPRLMSSSDWPQTRKGTGILSSHADENPHWYNTNIVFVPYCSSDVWSGNKPAAKNKPAKETEFSFMGSVIIRELIKDLALKGLKQAKLVMLAGASAGGTGVLLNMEKVANQLEQLGVEAQVRGLVDSGWFLESKHQKLSSDCPEGISCSPVDAIKRGIRLWNGVIPEKCKQNYKRGEEWQCFFGHKLYSFLNLPLFVVQWLFDEEQLRMEDIYMGGQTLSEQQWNYMQNLGKELKNSLRDVTNWVDFQVKGTSLSRALQCWDRSLQEVNRNSKVPLKGCTFHLIDTCHWPQCNPTCPALIDQATQQEMTLLQVLTKMGLDLQKLSSETHRDISGVVSNGG